MLKNIQNITTVRVIYLYPWNYPQVITFEISF